MLTITEGAVGRWLQFVNIVVQMANAKMNGRIVMKKMDHVTIQDGHLSRQTVKFKPLPVLIKGQYQDHFLALDLVKDQDQILFQYQNLDLARNQNQILFLYQNLDLVHDLGLVHDLDQGQNLCLGIIVEEHGSRMPSIIEVVVGSWLLFVNTVVQMANANMNGRIVMKKMDHLTIQDGHQSRQTVEIKPLLVLI